MMSTDNSKRGFAAITPPGSNCENRVAAPISLRVRLYDPRTANQRCSLPCAVVYR
jgi:hypothetical protein